MPKGIVSAHLAAALMFSIPVVATAETLMQKLTRIAGLNAVSADTRGAAGEVVPGNIWMASAETGGAKALTTDGGYTSPTFSPDGRVYALRRGAVVRLPQETGAGVVVHMVPGAAKLVGFDSANTDDLVLLFDAPRAGSPLGVLSLASGKVAPLPHDATSEEERRFLARIRSGEREYGTTRVYTTKAQSRSGLSGSDVYIRRGSAAPRNVSKCDGARCAQPALSPDGRIVTFIKAGS